MSQNQRNAPRKPATKLPHLRKKMDKTKVVSHANKKFK
jgi:hypothetical protein